MDTIQPAVDKLDYLLEGIVCRVLVVATIITPRFIDRATYPKRKC